MRRKNTNTQLTVLIAGIVLIYCGTTYATENKPDFKDSVVKVFASTSPPDFYRPWQTKGAMRVTGSGAVIEGKRILTNAHVVNYGTFIEVKKSGSDRRYKAEVEAIGNDCDLALLKVNDPDFFKSVAPLAIGKLPELRDTVLVVGYPKGGEELSVTQGVVSRIDAVSYTHSGLAFVAAQIDAAVNSGNSGGPVLQDGRLVGIAFQGLKDSDNIGYMIPEPIIKHFLDDLKDGRYDGFPRVGIFWNETSNPSLRQYCGIQDQEGGVVIKNAIPSLVEKNILLVGDVLLKEDGIPIGADATVPFRKNARLPVDYWFDTKQVGETTTFDVLRKGERMSIKAPMLADQTVVKHKNYYETPPYYIRGGMIFTVLSEDLLDSLKEKKEFDVSNLLYYQDGPGRFEEESRKEVVVFLYVLPDDVNAGYHDRMFEVVEEANGVKIRSFRDFVLAVERNDKDFDVIRTDEKAELILNRKAAADADPGILRRYKITSPYPEDVKKIVAGQ